MSEKSLKKSLSIDDMIAIAIFTFYMMVDFIPTFSSYTHAEPQWLFINVLNFGIALYLYYKQNFIDNFIFKSISSNKIIIFYVSFLVLSGFSIIVALNFDESFITLLRYLVSFTTMCLLFFIFYNKQHLFLILASIISILLFVECYNGLQVFFQNHGKLTLNEMLSRIDHHHDNKNIFAASILLKIPFVILCFIKTVNWRKLIFGFILLTCCFTIFFLGSRAIIAGMLLQICVFIILNIMLWFYKKTTFNWVNTFVPVAMILLSFLTYSGFLNKSENKIALYSSQSQQTAVAQRSTPAVNLDQSSLDIRKLYWLGAIEMIEEKPFLGCGLGNWKIFSQKYEHRYSTSNINSVHAHNDFLEVSAETGILNGILYVLIFGFLIIQNVKVLVKSPDENQIYLSLILILSVIGLVVDNFFNFPLSRPTIQILFVILILFSILNSVDNSLHNSSLKTTLSKNVIFILILISFASLYPNYLLFDFYKSLKIAKTDATSLNLSYAEVSNLLPNFPSLDETASPISDLKVNYLLKENKFNKALQLLNTSQKTNPFSLYATSLKVDLFNKKMQYDSAVVNAKKTYLLKPNYQVYFERYMQGLARVKDTSAILKTFRNLEPNKLNANHFYTTFGCLLKAGYKNEKSFKFITDGLLLFPQNEQLLKTKSEIEGSEKIKNSNLTESELQKSATKTGNYAAIEAFYITKYTANKSDFSTAENLGICYFQQKKYSKAISLLEKVSDSKTFINGKSEYVMALCYANLGNKNKACELALKSQMQNFKDATPFINQNCK